MRKLIFMLLAMLIIPASNSYGFDRNQAQTLLCKSALKYGQELEEASGLIKSADAMTLEQAYMIDEAVNGVSNNLEHYLENFYLKDDKNDTALLKIAREFNAHKKIINRVTITVTIFNGEGWREALEKYKDIRLVSLDKQINSYFGVVYPTYKSDVESAYNRISKIKKDIAIVSDHFCVKK